MHKKLGAVFDRQVHKSQVHFSRTTSLMWLVILKAVRARYNLHTVQLWFHSAVYMQLHIHVVCIDRINVNRLLLVATDFGAEVMQRCNCSTIW